MDFTKSHDVVMAAQQRDLMLQRMNDLEASYQQTEAEMSDTEHRVRELDAQLAKLPAAETLPRFGRRIIRSCCGR